MGCFSFYPGKNLGACGEAGAVVTSDEACVKRIRELREHGQEAKYFHVTEGYNGRLDALQAAFLRIKLRRLEKWNAQRRQVAAWYRAAFQNVPDVRMTSEEPGAVSSWHLFVVRVTHRDSLREYLQARGVATGLHYPLPLHLQKAYSAAGYKRGDLPVAERAATELLSLPMYPGLTESAIDRVASAIRGFYG